MTFTDEPYPPKNGTLAHEIDLPAPCDGREVNRWLAVTVLLLAAAGIRLADHGFGGPLDFSTITIWTVVILGLAAAAINLAWLQKGREVIQIGAQEIVVEHRLGIFHQARRIPIEQVKKFDFCPDEKAGGAYNFWLFNKGPVELNYGDAGVNKKVYFGGGLQPAEAKKLFHRLLRTRF